MHQLARRGADMLVRAELTVACMNDAGKPVRLPPLARAALAVVSAEAPRSRHIRI
jgi:acyl-CoA thioester hydrolase